MTEKESTSTRSIDIIQPASVDLVELNNEIVTMRPLVKKTKIQSINKLARHISVLKRKRGGEKQVEKNKRKAERLLEEIEIIKNLKVDRISKFALANTDTLSNVQKQASSSSQTKALIRLAEHNLLKTPVSSFRSKHDDWKALTTFMLTKNSGRRFKKKKENNKRKVQTNVKASEVLMKSYLEKKLGPGVTDPIIKKKSVLKQSPPLERSTRNLSVPTTSSAVSPVSQNKSMLCEPVRSEHCRKRTEMVVKKITLDNLDEELRTPKQTPRKTDLIPAFLTNDDQENTESLKTVEASKSRTKDSFFMSNDSDGASENEQEEDSDGYFSSDSEDPHRPKPRMESSFIDSLADKKGRKKSNRRNNFPSEKKMKETDFSKQRNRWLTDSKPKFKAFREQRRTPGKSSAQKRINQNTGLEPSLGKPKKVKSDIKEEKLHPSWEASKKKKEQLGKIQPFQGKRIKFDD